jgi:hypothetical protein
VHQRRRAFTGFEILELLDEIILTQARESRHAGFRIAISAVTRRAVRRERAGREIFVPFVCERRYRHQRQRATKHSTTSQIIHGASPRQKFIDVDILNNSTIMRIM